MPENQNPDNHVEQTNSYQYNPNRPQNDPNDHSNTQKVVDTVGKGAAEYLAPGVGGMAYDAAKNAPVVGDAIDRATSDIAKRADQVPGVSKLTQGLNDSGITDAANRAIGLAGSNGANAGAEVATGTSDVAKNTGNVGKKAVSNSTPPIHDATNPIAPMRKNAMFHSMMQNDDTENMSEGSSDDIDSDDVVDDSSSGNTPPPIDLPLDDIDEPSNEDERENRGDTSDLVGQGLQMIWKKYKIPIILIGGGVALLLLLLLSIFGGGAGEALQETGYYDALCNYNDTKVTLTNCYQNNSDKVELSTYELDDFVISMTYAYTKDGNYSEEAIKALMVALKTNALSYGNYNNSDKNIEVRICDLYSGYDQSSNEAEDELWMFDGIDEQRDALSEMYNEISNYLYISSSYRSTISTLSRQNALILNQSVLDQFQSLAEEENNFSQILDTFYNSNSSEEEVDQVYRETLFLGDSRIRGMQNSGVINSGNTIYGIGYGYDWLVGNGSFSSSYTNATTGGIQGINSLMRDQASYNIVIWLGGYDLENVNQYYQEYYDLATGEWRDHHIYIVSVGPVESTLTNVSNSSIDAFNQEMQSLIQGSGLDNLFYIDLGYTEESILAFDEDGFGYSSGDYHMIYETIMNHLDTSLSSSYQLYNLTSYCTYYTVTENDAYWWPVGSRDATQGNIYGGDPVSVNITSYFGGRYHPVTGEWQDAHGALDIGTSEGTPVIATKNGTINYTYTGCRVGNQSCGGGYGNYIKIDHGDGIESLYAHLSEVLVENGETVVQGQIIGYSGNTGRSTGPHLHFEIRLNGTRVDPLDYVDPDNPRPINQQDINFILSGNSEDNKNMVCESLLSSGLSENAVAGIMVNMQAESGFNPINLQNSYETSLGYTDSSYTLAVNNGTYRNFVHDSAGYGIVQWTYYNRKQNLYNFAQSRNASIGDLGMQLEFFLQELSGYTTTYKYVTGNYSAYDISYNFCTEYERPSNTITTCTNRINSNLNSMLQYVQNDCSN